ncbi:MAG: glycosyltransferase family 4 protein [Nitrospirota bacterium]|nr:glycosyltransferase family 4 protein [Nitrospirota bacterium]
MTAGSAQAMTPQDTALIYIHSPRYAEIGAALEALPVTLVTLPYERYFLPGHALAITVRVPGVGELFSRRALNAIAALPHRHKIVLTDRLLLDSWFVDRIKALGCRYVVRLRGDAWREYDEVVAARWWWTRGKAEWYRGVWFHNLAVADAVWPMSEHLQKKARELLPGTPMAVVRSTKPVGRVRTGYVPDPARGVRALTATVYMFRLKTEGVLRLYGLMEAVMAARPEVNWTLAGDGRYFRLSRDRWRASRFRGRIEFPGRVNDLPRRMGEADVLVYCSEMDVFPNVVVDAMAAGLPVLCNRWGPFDELFTGELSWCLYDDEAGFVEKFAHLIDEPDHYRKMVEAGVARVREFCSVERVGADLLEALAGVPR